MCRPAHTIVRFSKGGAGDRILRTRNNRTKMNSLWAYSPPNWFLPSFATVYPGTLPLFQQFTTGSVLQVASLLCRRRSEPNQKINNGCAKHSSFIHGHRSQGGEILEEACGEEGQIIFFSHIAHRSLHMSCRVCVYSGEKRLQYNGGNESGWPVSFRTFMKDIAKLVMA